MARERERERENEREREAKSVYSVVYSSQRLTAGQYGSRNTELFFFQEKKNKLRDHFVNLWQPDQTSEFLKKFLKKFLKNFFRIEAKKNQ